MTLRLQVKFLNSLTVVNCFGVDLVVAKNYTLPDRLVCLLEVDVQELVVLYTPEGVIHLDLLAELALDQGLVFLALEGDAQLLGLNFNDQVLRGRSLGERDLQVDSLDLLGPVVLRGLGSIIRADFRGLHVCSHVVHSPHRLFFLLLFDRSLFLLLA